MSQKLLIYFILFFAKSLFAQSPRVVGFGLNAFIEEEADQKYAHLYNGRTLFVQLPSSLPRWSYFLELQHFSRQGEEGSLSVRYDRWVLNPWLQWDVSPHLSWHWFFGGGMGLSRERVQSQLGIIKDKQWGDEVYTLNGKGGVFKVFYKFFFTQVSLDIHLPIFREERDIEFLSNLRFGYAF